MCFILEQLLQYKGPESDNPGLTNLREEIRYHSRTTRDVSQSSSPENMTRNGTVSPSSAPGNTTETIRVSFTYYDRMMREAKKSDRLSLLNVLYFFYTYILVSTESPVQHCWFKWSSTYDKKNKLIDYQIKIDKKILKMKYKCQFKTINED